MDLKLQSGLSLSFNSLVALIFTPVANLLLHRWIGSTTGQFTRNIKDPSSMYTNITCVTSYGPYWQPCHWLVRIFRASKILNLLYHNLQNGKVYIFNDFCSGICKIMQNVVIVKSPVIRHFWDCNVTFVCSIDIIFYHCHLAWIRKCFNFFIVN